MTKAYFCDICGERYDTEELADRCEENCKAKKLKRENLAKEKEERLKRVTDKYEEFLAEVKQYGEDYGESPVMTLSGKKNYNTLRLLMFPWS